MMSVTMRKAWKIAKRHDAKLKASDFKDRIVQIVDDEGSTFVFHRAFLRKIKIEKFTYLAVFTEHHGFHVFPIDELTTYGEYSRRDKIKTLKKGKSKQSPEPEPNAPTPAT